MKRREFFGKSMVGSFVAAVSSVLPTGAVTHTTAKAREFPDDHDASEKLKRSDWKPVFLSDHQNETLIVLSDMIIPATDTPGAKAALVNRFIDWLLAAETREVQKEFTESLAFMDGECRQKYGEAFVHLAGESQTEFLTFVAYPHRLVTWMSNRSEYAGHGHFNRLKDWIARAYYRSETGMKELGWDGNVFHQKYVGCAHPPGTHERGQKS